MRVLVADKPWLTANQRLHFMAKARITKKLRRIGEQQGRLFVFEHGKQSHVHVWMEWVVTDARRRDEDNIVPTYKALCDGLVDAGVVPDDTPKFMTKHMPSIPIDKTRPGVWLIVESFPDGAVS